MIYWHDIKLKPFIKVKTLLYDVMLCRQCWTWIRNIERMVAIERIILTYISSIWLVLSCTLLWSKHSTTSHKHHSRSSGSYQLVTVKYNHWSVTNSYQFNVSIVFTKRRILYQDSYTGKMLPEVCLVNNLFISPMFVYIFPMFVYIFPMFVYIFPMFVYIFPMLVYIFPMFVYIFPMLVYISPMFVYIFTFSEGFSLRSIHTLKFRNARKPITMLHFTGFRIWQK